MKAKNTFTMDSITLNDLVKGLGEDYQEHKEEFIKIANLPKEEQQKMYDELHIKVKAEYDSLNEEEEK